MNKFTTDKEAELYLDEYINETGESEILVEIWLYDKLKEIPPSTLTTYGETVIQQVANYLSKDVEETDKNVSTNKFISQVDATSYIDRCIRENKGTDPTFDTTMYYILNIPYSDQFKESWLNSELSRIPPSTLESYGDTKIIQVANYLYALNSEKYKYPHIIFEYESDDAPTLVLEENVSITYTKAREFEMHYSDSDGNPRRTVLSLDMRAYSVDISTLLYTLSTKAKYYKELPEESILREFADNLAEYYDIKYLFCSDIFGKKGSGFDTRYAHLNHSIAIGCKYKGKTCEIYSHLAESYTGDTYKRVVKTIESSDPRTAFEIFRELAVEAGYIYKLPTNSELEWLLRR